MKNITYENQGNSTYLVYEIDATDIVDNLSLGMINNNKIIGLAPVIYSQVDDKKYLKYNISAKVSAAAFLAGAASRNRILGVFSGVSKALLSAEEYMLDANTIILDLDYIYVDVTTCEAELICLPVQRGNFNDVVSFFKNIIFSVTYDQTENCDYVAKIIGCLNSHSSFSLQNFMQTIDELNGKRINIQNLQNSHQLEPQPNYTEVLHGESQEIKSATENQQRITPQGINLQGINPQGINPQGINPQGINSQGTGMALQSPQIQNNSGYPYNNTQNQPPIQLQGIPTGNIYYANQPVGNQNNISLNHGTASGYQPARSDTIPPNPASFGRTAAQNQKPQKKQKTEKKKKKGQAPPPVSYTVPGAPPFRTGEPMPAQNTGISRKTEKPQKKSGGMSGLFHKKNKSQNIPPNNIARNYQIPNGMGGIPNGMNQNNMGSMPNGVNSNGINSNNMNANGMDGIPNNMNLNGIGGMPNNMNLNGTGGMPSGMNPNTMTQQTNTQYMTQGENQNLQYASRSLDFGQTTVLDANMADGQTSVLSAPAVAQPYLVRKKNNEKIFIHNAFFRIGKEANYVDYFIGDNSAISRSHANIINNGKDYYIVDTNSKNHTYVNGQMIQSNTETLLTHGSIVKLANEEFEFRVY